MTCYPVRVNYFSRMAFASITNRWQGLGFVGCREPTILLASAVHMPAFHSREANMSGRMSLWTKVLPVLASVRPEMMF